VQWRPSLSRADVFPFFLVEAPYSRVASCHETGVKMFEPKKMIPAIAAGVLALTGCSSDDGNTAGGSGAGGTAGTAGSGGTAGAGGGPSDALANSLSAFCMKLVDCFPSYYGTPGECADYISNYYGLGDGVSPACEAAAISYFDCAAPLTCEQLDADPSACDDEATAAEQACTPA